MLGMPSLPVEEHNMLKLQNTYAKWGGIYKLGGAAAVGAVLVFECLSSFVSGLTDFVMVLAGLGGIFSMIWYFLIAARLFKLAKQENSL